MPNKFNIIGIGGLLGHDANAALIQDGRIILAAQEERYSRKKHDYRFPESAIADCLSAGAITAEEIDVVVLAEKPLQTYFNDQLERSSNKFSDYLGKLKLASRFSTSFFEKDVKKLFPNARIKYSWHHLSHAISSFYSSGFDEAAFLCVDGKGEFANASVGYIDKQHAVITHELPYSNGLGMLYTVLTNFLGFHSFGSEYKVMGLAPYGKPVYVDKIKKLYREDADGAIRLLRKPTFHPESIKKIIPWVSEIIGMKPRGSNEDLTAEHTNVAASLQLVFEEIILKMARFTKAQIKTENILFCGGCAQNCVSAGKLRDAGIFKKTYNSPVGGDMASGLGAALAYLHKTQQIDVNKLDFKGYYLGAKPGLVSVSEAANYAIDLQNENILKEMAVHLANGKIIGWVHSGMELGARALGARSILASPLEKNIQSDLNLKIKFRESFRPFAPAILSEDVNEWFDISQPSNYMQYTAYLKPELRYDVPDDISSFKEKLNYPRCKIPSVVHVDYSARLQTVSLQDHPEFHQLISEFKQITGVPILINTSFNVNGQPIVRTANEAWECFVNTEIDFLVVDDKMYRNPQFKTTEQKIQWLKQFENYSK